MTYAMIAGGFDLSVGAIYATGAVTAASLGQTLSLWVAVPVAIVVGAGLGALNGAIVTGLRVNPFIATLGSGFVYGGLAFIFTGSAPVLVRADGFQELGQGRLAGIPVSILIGIVVFVVAGLVLARTVYGQNVYAVGGNTEAARLAGLRTRAVQSSTYIIVGALAALAGAILASRIGVGQADVGANVTLQVIAVVVIGGTSLFGGEGSIPRTLIGLLILAVIKNVSDSLGWDSNVENVTTGVIVVAAVAADAALRRLAANR
ncbi:ribose ABC transporter permease [Microbacterium sp. Leaf288]|nr:ribose ABC transporter permease [Microbacterium sp. Leaf288]